MNGANPDERPTQNREYSGPGSTLGLAALIVLVVVGLFWYFELRSDPPTIDLEEGMGIVALPDELNPAGEKPSARVGKLAPDFRLRTPDDEVIRLSDYRGEYVLVNFWAASCGPCRRETPALQEFFAEHQASGLMIIGVNQQESAETASDFAALFGVTYPIVLDFDASVSIGYSVSMGLPVSLLVDPDGVVVELAIGELPRAQLSKYAETYPF